MAPIVELRRAENGCPDLRTGARRHFRVARHRLAGLPNALWRRVVIRRPTSSGSSGARRRSIRTKKYPVIENIYAGPQDSFVPKQFSPYFGAQSLAELGFILVQIDGMGTSNRSKSFHDVCWKNLGDAGLPDRIAWIKAAAAQYPSLDISRVGIYGGSAGGQSAVGALLAHGDFYKVGVADCGCHDNRMDKIWWNELWMGWPIGPHYAEQSNVTNAHQLAGKLLLIVGELDHNVDPASTHASRQRADQSGQGLRPARRPGRRPRNCREPLRHAAPQRLLRAPPAGCRTAAGSIGPPDHRGFTSASVPYGSDSMVRTYAIRSRRSCG